MKLYAVIGAPSAEKHLVGRLLGARLRTPVLSVRALVGTEVEHRTHMGMRLEEAQRSASPGELLPTQLVWPLILQAVQSVQRSGGSGAVLIGAPRSHEQWTMLRNMGISPELVHLVMPDARKAHRQGARRVCAGCSYPLYPPEDASTASGAALAGCGCDDATPNPLPRLSLDTEEGGLRQRNAEWEVSTVPMLERLRERGSGLHEVKVLEDLEHTWASVQVALDIP